MKINIEKIYIDGELPKSCASCQFLVHCDECEGHENYCPFIGSVGYDISDSLIDGTPVTPVTHRHRHCPVVKRQHGEWIKGKEISRTMLGDKTLHIDYKDFTCSVCGLVLDRLIYHVDGSPFYKFCPNCGADMREGE